MNVFPKIRFPRNSGTLRAPLIALMLLLPAFMLAQDVPVTVGGQTIPQIAVPPVYNGKFVLQLSTWGFFWLDTETLTAGHVQVISLCLASFPPSDSGYYLAGGDCNSFSNIASSGGVVVAYTTSGLCWAKQRGCGGPRDDGHMLLAFGLGEGWPFLGDVADIPPNSTQPSDPQGRTWTVVLADTTYRNFIWRVTGGGATPIPTSTPTAAFTPTPTPTPTPGPGARATNQSSLARGDSVNYYGDQWRLEDISNPSPTTQTDWDFNYSGSFLLDEGGTPANEGTVEGYFPCEPKGAPVGDFHTGANCMQSLGLSNPPEPRSYQFAMLSSVSASPFVSPAFQVVCPQVSIVGYTGFTGTCAKTGGTLTVATGGIADARISKGNTTGGQFDWTFPGSLTPNVSGPAPGVPNDATTFTLTITFPGGYTATASGAVTIIESTPILGVFTDAAATIPATSFGGSAYLTAGTTYYLKDVEAVAPASAHFYFNSGTGDVELPGSPTSGPGPLAWIPSSPCPITTGCSVKVTVGTLSSSSLVVISPGGTPTPLPTATPGPFPTPTPPVGGSLSVSVTGPTSGARNAPLTFTANVNGGSGSYSYSWVCAYNPSFPSFSPGSQTRTCTYSVAGTYVVKVQVGDTSTGATSVSPDYVVTITGGLPPPSSDFAITGPTVTFNTFVGRYEASTGSPITFTAAEVETNAASYTWNFGDGGPSGSGRSVTHTYNSARSYSVSLTVAGNETTSSGTSSATKNITITGPPAPSTAYTVAGATQTGANAYTAEAGRTITFTATATQASGYVWDFGDETKSGKSATKTYSAPGARTVRLTVTGDGTNTSGTASVDIAMTVTPPSFRAVIVPGAAHLDDGTTTWGTDASITNGGTASMNLGLAFVPLVPDSDAPASLDLTQLNYGSPIALSPGASYSVNDVVAALNGGNNKGTLVIKYSDSVRAPLVSARVYFQPKVNPDNVSYGSGIPAYEVDGSGEISPQGFVSTAFSRTPSGLGTESETAALDFPLSVSLTGSGSGTVTSDPAGINCPATCSANFPTGASVLLTGAAAPGSTFYGFTGCDSSIFGQCQVSMSSSKSVTARFDSSGPAPTPTPGPTNFTLTVTKGGTGSGTVSSAPAGISCGATCSVTFAQGTSVTLTAAPDSGSSFTGWAGACSGTGNCSVTLSADQSATATFTAAPAPSLQGDQVLIGLRSDPRYRFVVTLFNASWTQGNFELQATDDQGAAVVILDASGSLVASRKFNNLGPYQQVYLRDSDLFRDSDLGLGKHYVLKATATKGTLLAFGTALDRKTLDLVQISDDSQASPAEDGIVSYWVAGVSRYDTTYGAHWRTDLRIFNRGSKPRNLSFQYHFTNDGLTEHVAEVANLSIAAGQLLTYEDVIGALLAKDTRVDLSENNAGVLRIFYPEDDESATRPLIIGSRNYNDDPTGTAGSQLAVYTGAQAGSDSHNLSLTGVEDSARYASRIGVFAMDPGPVTGRIVVVAPDGSEVGSVGFTLGGSSPRYGQISLTDSNMNFTNPGKPVSIRFEQLRGGRVGAYAFTVDKVTLDTNFIQALPQN